MILYKNTKAIFHSSDGDNFFDIVTGVLQGDTLALYLLIIYVDYVLQTLIEIIKMVSYKRKKYK